MSALAGLGVKQVAVPEADLSTLPLDDQVFTFAQPTKLSVPGPDIMAVGADTELSARVALATSPATAVLVANQFLAELAMIDLERPSDQRGVVIIPGPGVEVNPVFLSVLLAGLKGNPLVEAVNLQQVFKDVPPAPSDSGAVMVRQLNAPTQPGAELAGAEQLQQALDDVAADGQVYGQNVSLVKGLDQRLFVSLSSSFDGSQRASIISKVLRTANSALANVRLPPSISITLTSRQGRLPLTLVSTATAPVRVRLVLTSEQLSFLAVTFGEGSCVPGNAEKSAESCQLTLSRPTTLLRIPVVVRAPGAFPLSLQIETPSGNMVLRTGTGSVTSTAISDVGWFLMVGAALFLGVWWVRNARHGRRAHQLIPRPDDDPAAPDPASPDPASPDSPSAGPATTGSPMTGPVSKGSVPVPSDPQGRGEVPAGNVITPIAVKLSTATPSAAKSGTGTTSTGTTTVPGGPVPGGPAKARPAKGQAWAMSRRVNREDRSPLRLPVRPPARARPARPARWEPDPVSQCATAGKATLPSTSCGHRVDA